MREDVLEAVGGPEPVFAGALAELSRGSRRPATRSRSGTILRPRGGRCRAGSRAKERRGCWLFRRHPARFPLPRPRELGWRLPFVAAGALRANGVPTRG